MANNPVVTIILLSYAVRDVMSLYRPDSDGEETVLDIARLMAQTGQAAVPIAAADGTVMGILLAQDIVMSLGRGDDPAVIKAAEIAPGTVTIGPDASLEEATELLLENRGLAAVVDDGALVGVIELWQIEKYLEALEALGPNAAHLITEVSPQDYGTRQWRGASLMAGVSALECIRDAMGAANKDGVTNLLDFPSGYGRILRVLKAAFPDAKLAAGDIVRDAVDFCVRVFAATPIYSKSDPENIEIDDTFDLIWSGSLLTHINSNRWPGFLALFRDCLASDGLLVFTANGHQIRTKTLLQGLQLTDDQVERVLRDYDRDGFGYGDYPRQENYGISLASPDWVRGQLDAAGLRVVSYQELGWYAPAPRQDVVACVPA